MWDTYAHRRDEIDGLFFFCRDRVAVARAILVAALTGADIPHYDQNVVAFVLRWRWEVNGKQFSLTQLFTPEHLKRIPDTMAFAEQVEATALRMWVKHRYHGEDG